MTTSVVAETADHIQATIWIDALRDEGIRAAIFEIGPGGAFGGATITALSRYRVMVDDDHFGDARNVIASLSGGASLSPFPAAGGEQTPIMRTIVLVGIGVGVAIVTLGTLLLSRNVGG